MYSSQPAVPSPVLDFLLRVNAKEKVLDYGMLGDLRGTLDSLVGDYNSSGVSSGLERRARTWLMEYQALDNGVLTSDERAQLARVLEGSTPRTREYRVSRTRAIRWPRLNRTTIIALVVALVLAIAGGIILAAVSSGNTPPAAQSGSVQRNPISQQVPPGTNDLQKLMQKFGPWKQLTPSTQFPQTGSPALLVLESGNYYASENWTIPTNQPGWQPDQSGLVTGVDVQGNYAVIEDQNGNQYVVRIGQPFIFSDNPTTVVRIDPIGNVYTLELTFAKSERYK